MYENATVLDYRGRKIWIKHIDNTLYLTNGALIIFDAAQDISNAAVISEAIDIFWSPLCKDAGDRSMLVHYTYDSRPTSYPYRFGVHHVSHCTFDCSTVEDAFREYNEWEASNKHEAFINNFRDMDPCEWSLKYWAPPQANAYLPNARKSAGFILSNPDYYRSCLAVDVSDSDVSYFYVNKIDDIGVHDVCYDEKDAVYEIDRDHVAIRDSAEVFPRLIKTDNDGNILPNIYVMADNDHMLHIKPFTLREGTVIAENKNSANKGDT